MDIISATLDNFELNLLSINDTVDMALVEHEFINTDGAYIQHMGNHAKTINFQCYFYGADPDIGSIKRASYKNHYDFINAMTDSVTAPRHKLKHPQYGLITVYVSSIAIFHDDTQQFATIDLSLIEADIQKTVFDTNEVFQNVDGQNIELINSNLIAASNTMQSAGHSTLLGKIIDPAQKLASQFASVTQATRIFLNECDKNLDTLDSFLADVTAPVTAIEQAVNFISDVPSRILGSMNSACNRIITAFADVSNLPVQFTNNVILNCQNIYNTFSLAGPNSLFFQTHFMAITAGAIANTSCKFIQTDAERQAMEKAKELLNPFDPTGRRINIVQFNPIMTTNELNFLLSITRTYIQKALILDRSNQALKDMAASLINISSIDRMTIKSMTVNSIPMHMLCLQLGLPYNAADRMLALNPQIKNPNFCEGVMNVFVK